MENVEKAIEEAVANLNVDNLNVNKEQIDIIKKHIESNDDKIMDEFVEMSNKVKSYEK